MAKTKTKTRPPQVKQYYVLIDYKESLWKKGWEKGQIIHIPLEEAVAYIGPKIITPLKTALDTKQYIPNIEIASYKKSPLDPVDPPPAPEPKSTLPEKKTIVKNTLRAAVQQKKETAQESTPPSSIFTSKSKEKPQEETETKPEEKKLSAAEAAIQAKIAAAKKKK